MQDKKKICFWSLLLIIFIILAMLFTVRTIHKYELWKEHEEFLKSDKNYVENWMHINLISKRSGIPKDVIYDEIGIEESFTNNRKPLLELCEENNLNCTLINERLNHLVVSGKQGKE